MKILFSILSLSALLLISCSTSTPTSSNTNTQVNNAPKDSMLVTIDGVNKIFAASGKTSTFFGITTTTTISGNDTLGNTIVTIVLSNITTTGTYQIGPINSVSGPATGVTLSYAPNSTSGYGSSSNAVAGTIVITEFTAASFKATFNAVLPRVVGTTGAATAAFTNGAVNAAIH